MSIELADIFPNISQGLSNIGFFFGAGASVKAGYPLMPQLTTDVLNQLKADEISVLEDLVRRSEGRDLDKSTGNPNIETIVDILEAAIISSDTKSPTYRMFLQTRDNITIKIVEIISTIERPDLSDHLRFFSALGRLFSGRLEPVWIFTLNYDLLFEISAGMCKIPLYDGFFGSSLPYFSPSNLHLFSGYIDGIRFKPYSQPFIRLVKLHGSLNWWKEGPSIYRTHRPDLIQGNPARVIVMPRRKKLTDTLAPPFNDLFRIASQSIGSSCKYLVTCGYGFGDQHINETLLLPKVREGKIQLTALMKADSNTLDPFKQSAAFLLGTESITRKRGISNEGSGTEIWQFDKLVDSLCKVAGI